MSLREGERERQRERERGKGRGCPEFLSYHRYIDMTCQ